MKKIKLFFKKYICLKIKYFNKRIALFFKKVFFNTLKNNNLLIIIVTIIFFILFIFLFKFHINLKSLIDNIVLINEININSTMAVIGAAILGALAIIFSLSIFSIQQASNIFTATILKRLVNDKKGLFYFSGIASISFIFFFFFFFYN